MIAMRGSQKSLILIARQLGVHIGPNDIPERFRTDDRELSSKEMCELAQSFNLKAKQSNISNDELIKLTKKKQQILRLQNGRFIIALRIIQREGEQDSILFLDPGKSDPKPQQIEIIALLFLKNINNDKKPFINEPLKDFLSNSNCFGFYFAPLS